MLKVFLSAKKGNSRNRTAALYAKPDRRTYETTDHKADARRGTGRCHAGRRMLPPGRRGRYPSNVAPEIQWASALLYRYVTT